MEASATRRIPSCSHSAPVLVTRTQVVVENNDTDPTTVRTVQVQARSALGWGPFSDPVTVNGYGTPPHSFCLASCLLVALLSPSCFVHLRIRCFLCVIVIPAVDSLSQRCLSASCHIAGANLFNLAPRPALPRLLPGSNQAVYYLDFGSQAGCYIQQTGSIMCSGGLRLRCAVSPLLSCSSRDLTCPLQFLLRLHCSVVPPRLVNIRRSWLTGFCLCPSRCAADAINNVG